METWHDAKLAQLSLQPIFGRAFKTQRLLHDHHPGQASYLWKVLTKSGTVAVRTPRVLTPPDQDFYQGVLRIFDANTADVSRIALINRLLAPASLIPVPNVRFSRSYAGHTFLVLEWLPGHPLKNFGDLPQAEAERLGHHTARLHNISVSAFGSPRCLDNSRFGHPLGHFFPRVRATITLIARRYHADDPEMDPWVGAAEKILTTLPAPQQAVPVMIDLDPSQFLCHKNRLSGLVDTELYVAAPRELELAAYELLLPTPAAQAFRRGYDSYAPMPSLAPYRTVYRVLLRLLSFQGPVPWETWMTMPVQWD